MGVGSWTVGWVAILASSVAACGAAEDAETPGESLQQAQMSGGGGGGSNLRFAFLRRGSTVEGFPYAGVQDATIQLSSPELGADAYCSTKGGSVPRECLMRFDVSMIPTTATVVGVTLRLPIADPSVSTFSISSLKRSWSEFRATWTKLSATASWQVPGAAGPADVAPTAFATITPSATGSQELALPNSLVQFWVENPAKNYGFVFRNINANDGFAIYSSEHEASQGQLQPMMTVTYLLN